MEYSKRPRSYDLTKRGNGFARNGNQGARKAHYDAHCAETTEEIMFEEITARKADLGFRWIRSTSGTTYLCPASQYSKLRDAADEVLRETCINESHNPQND